jgi:NAD(P)H-hydrate epimerase
MRILSTREIRNADRYTIENEPISSLNLMERAAKTVFDRLREEEEFPEEYIIVCGMGNNGGDGLVIARLMAEKNLSAQVYILKHREKGSDDFMVNLDRLKEIGVEPIWVENPSFIEDIAPGATIIDCMLGSGLSSPLKGVFLEVVEALNQTSNLKIAIDVPTGLFGEDNSNNDQTAVLQVNTTYAFHTPRLSFFDPVWGRFAGDWEVVDIGLMEDGAQRELKYHAIAADEVSHLLRPRNKFSHKGDYGHLLVLAGSRGMLGAGHLSSSSALKAGAGKVTWHVPKDCWHTAQLFAPEVMIGIDEEEGQISRFPLHGGYNSVVFGPGIGVSDRTEALLKQVLNNANVPILFDADALTLLANNPTLMAFLPSESILTPHPGEMDRLLGKRYRGWDQIEAAIEFATQKKVYIVLKGAHTAICTPSGEVFFNTTGNPGMATAGSGDVLAGIIGGLLAAGYRAFYAAILGVYLHGLAGDFAQFQYGEISLMASDIREKTPHAFGFLTQ